MHGRVLLVTGPALNDSINVTSSTGCGEILEQRANEWIALEGAKSTWRGFEGRLAVKTVELRGRDGLLMLQAPKTEGVETGEGSGITKGLLAQGTLGLSFG